MTRAAATTLPDADVLVVGGGLAGTVTARACAQRGLTAVVIDRAMFPRDKPCGEGLLPHGVATLRAMGLAEALEACAPQPFRGILYRVGAVVAAGDFPDGVTGRGVRRRLFDDALRRVAAREPRVTFVHATVRDAVADGRGASVVLDDGRRLHGRLLVGADGPRSSVRHRLGLDGGIPRRTRHAIRGHFRLPPGMPLPARVEVTMGAGYEVYVTPVAPGLIGVAVLAERDVLRAGHGDADARLRTLVDAVPEVRARLDGVTPDDDALACGPLRVRATALHRERAVLVGDAAGYVDAITGEGMTLALRTADDAARAIAAVLQDGVAPARAFARHARARAAIFRDHAVLTHGLVWLARHPTLARRAVARLARDPALFGRLLAVNDGSRSLWSLPLLDALKLAVGARPVTVVDAR